MRNSNFRKSMLEAGSALRVLAMVGTGMVATTVAIVPAAAQDFTNVTASGRVVSTSGDGIAGATVTVRSDAQGFSRTVRTDADGGYRVPQIPPGSYTFTVDAPDFDSFTDTGVVLDQRGASNQFALQPTGASDNLIIVTAAGRTQIVDFERTTTGLVVNVAELADRVPVGRDLTSIIELSPGVASGDSAFGNLASAVGSSVAENVFYINGLNITEYREGLGSVTVPFDFYESVEVKNGGYQAEFGRATGAFVNATTKSGSNEFHGSVKFNWEPDELQSDQPNTLFADNDFDSSERIDTIVQLSGPILKDRVFFYGLYNARDVSSRFASTTPNFGPTGDLLSVDGTSVRYDKSDSPFFGAKFDAVLGEGQRVEFTYFNTEGTTERTIFGDPSGVPYDNINNVPGPLNGRQTFEYGGENYVARYTGTWTEWLTLSAAYGRYNNRDNSVSSRDDFPFISEQRFGTATSIGNPVNAITLAEDEREFYRGDADLYFELLGSHHLKIGYDNEKLTSLNSTQYTGNVAYTYLTAGADNDFGIAEGQDYVEARTFFTGGTFRSDNESYYIQDSWSLFADRLTLQIGARNDKFSNRNANGEVFYDSGDNWQPRIGFTGDPFGDGRSKIYGSFGRYYLPIAANTNIRLGGAEIDYDRIFLLDSLNADNTPNFGDPVELSPCQVTSGNNCVNRNDGTIAPLDTLVATSLKNQSVDEYIIGGEQRIGNDIIVGLYGTYRNLNASLEDAAIDAGILNYCSDNGIADCGGGAFFGANQYALFNPGESVTITPAAPLDGSIDPITITADQLGYPAATREYKAITATFEREFDGVWSLQGSYTYSENKGNIEGGVKSDNGQTDSGLTTDFDFPSLTLGSFGFLPNHRAHNFKVFGSYAISDFIRVGVNGIVTSPRKFGCIGRVSSAISSFQLFQQGLSNDFGYAYGAAANFCVLDDSGNIVTNPSVTGDRSLVPRGTAFESDWNTRLDLDVAFRLPVDAFDGSLRFSVFNVFNSQAELDFQERGTTAGGTPRADYRAVTQYQPPRSVRVQFEVGF